MGKELIGKQRNTIALTRHRILQIIEPQGRNSQQRARMPFEHRILQIVELQEALKVAIVFESLGREESGGGFEVFNSILFYLPADKFFR